MVRRSALPSEEAVLFQLAESRTGPLRLKELAESLSLPRRLRRAFRALLRDMVDRGRIRRVKGQRFALPDRGDRVVGRVALTRRGDGFIRPDQEGQEVFVARSALHSAMDGDRVSALVERRPRGRTPAGRVVKVLDRAHETLVGTYRRGRRGGVVHPRDRRIHWKLRVPAGSEGSAADGDVVVARITLFGTRAVEASGVVETILGRAADAGVDILAVIHSHGLSVDFPPEVEVHADGAVARRRARAGQGRVDRTDVHAFTIDPADAKDHDDALSVRPLGDGSWEVGVHIADVSHFVEHGDPVDLEALKRGASVYLVDRVIPMLPPALSTDACSLLPNVDRFALSLFATLEDSGSVREARLERTRIRSRHKLSYRQAQAVLDGGRSIDARTDEALAQLSRLSRVLRARRAGRGALDFELPDARVSLGEFGEPLAVGREERLESHRLVEDFMLLANEIIARKSREAGLPILYRVHEPPAENKLVDLSSFLAAVGLARPRTDLGAKELRAVLARVRGRPEERLVSTAILHAMKRARYDRRNLGHFGLALSHYAHFTSPIRRYPDLWLHRVLAEALIQRRPLPEEWSGDALTAKAERCSVRERVAEAAERESVDLKKAEYMERHLGDEFAGTISGVTSFGLFVTLDEVFVEGLVHVRSMSDDYYRFEASGYRLVGERSGRRFRLGDALDVRVVRVDKEDRLIDLVLVDAGPFRARARGR